VKTRVTWIGLLAALGAIPLLARQETKKQDPEPPKKESRTGYLRRIYATDRCTYADAVRSVSALASGAPSDDDFAKLVDGLKGRGIVPGDWNLAEDSKLTKGTLAYLLCKTLGIKGGATMMITGVTRRYAFRECVYIALMTGSSTDEFVSGRDLIDTMQRADIFKAEGSLDRIRR